MGHGIAAARGWLAVAALMLATSVAPARAQDAGPLAAPALPDRRVVLVEAIDLPGGDLASVFDTTQAACVLACVARADCAAVTYNARSRACFLKAAASGPVPFPGALSGPVVAADPALQDRATGRLAGAGPWLTEDDRRAARRQAAELGQLYPGNGTGADAMRTAALQAGAAGDATAMLRWLGAVAALTDAASDWTALAQAMGAAADPPGADRDAAMAGAARAAWLNAWLRDPGTGAPALRRWAALAEAEGRGRDGLMALRLAATAAPGDPDVAADLAGFEERHGFRVTDSRVDADAPDPRACAMFSQELAAGVDIRPFVALPDPALAVEAQGWELCVTGMPRGQAVTFTLRPGLPAASGDTLAKAVPLTLYVRDRAPQARFAGRSYVLPATGDQGLTLRTVNAARVDLTLYRMSDRNIVRALREGIFATPIDDWKADVFTSQIGARVWAGQAEVAPPPGSGSHPVNAEVATRLDLRVAAGPLDPGVYALTAAVPEGGERSPAATQWFMISDLGISSWSGSDGLTVAVRGLSDAAARAGIEVALISRGNAVLGTALTDAEGIARFDAGLTRGQDASEPAVLAATRRDGGRVADLAFLSLLDPEFDLSDRGVEGQPPAPPIDVFVALDRGAYRAGEVAQATILTRDDTARAIDGLPLTAVVLRPDGVEHARLLAAPAGAGGYTLAVPIPDTAPRGAWRIDLRVEEQGDPLATARLLVEDFRPERIDFALDLPAAPQPASTPVVAEIAARWLFGAPAADLPVEGALRLTPASALPGFDGYVFGRHDDPASPQVVAMPAGRTDAQGRFAARVDLPPALSQAARPHEARLTLSVREGAGRPVERSATQLILPGRTAVGIRPGFADGTVPEGAEAAFQILALGPDLAPQATPLDWVLNRVETSYQWYAIGGDWTWEPLTRRTRVAGGALAAPAGPAALSVPVDWGRYELVVTAPDGAESALLFDAGWGAVSAGTDTPDRLRVTLDRPAYRAGDTARVTVEAAADGVAVVSVLASRVIALRTVPLIRGLNSVALPVTDDWGAGVYVAVSAIRPLAADAGRAPVRGLGIAHAAVDPAARRLAAALTVPAEVGPRGSAPVTLAVSGAAPGATVHATVWAVDQGILNLTGYQPPSASDHYFGQRRLGVGLRDLYGRLVLPGGAADGSVRSGGDAASMQTQAPPPTEKLMAWFSGPLVLDDRGRATVQVPLPDFNGTVRVMAIAWTDGAVGQADATMLVRDPVVMTVTAPAFLAPGDVAQAQVRLSHVAGPAGQVTLAALPGPADREPGPAEEGAAPADMPRVSLATSGLPEAVMMADRQQIDLPLTLTAPEAEGTARLRLSATLPDGRVVTKDLTIPVQRQDAAVTRSLRLTLAPGAAGVAVDLSALGLFRPGTGRVALTIGPYARLDVAGALARLARYPYGCTEQIAATALPLLYAGALMPDGAAPLPGADPAAIDQAVAQVLTRQSSGGGFGLWTAEAGDRWLDAFVTDFLARARAAGHAVPDQPFRAALTNLQNGLNAAPEPQFADPDENAATAYAAYVLAREGTAVISDLRYYADTGDKGFATPLAAAQLGAALAAVGDSARSDRMFRRAQALSDQGQDDAGRLRRDYGTLLRDRAGALAMAAEAGSRALDRDAVAAQLAADIDARRDAGAPLSTQEATWTVLAAQGLASGADAGGGVTLSGAPLSSPVQDLGEAGALPPVVLGNTGPAPAEVTIGATAVPAVAVAAGGTGFGITRRYFTPEGQPADPARLPLGTRLVAVIEVTPFAPADGRLIVADPLPAGFEIDNPNLLAQGEVEGLDWLGGTGWADMAEFRQDRFAAALTLTGTDPVRLAYRLRAVTPGTFHHPAATVEDMYRPDRRGWTDAGTTVIAP
ncbi:alpha-2-macroglobulin family protein [Paracoccus endophyticus]|uniref:alpha-2-macroglobulin family protein n=1 Tax=Paracoccus endophyticus TaxID=2233774 RepID=UPI000DD6DDD7|nr:alpha-2-macroglobulin family protein [Paracoccus endophyticus]